MQFASESDWNRLQEPDRAALCIEETNEHYRGLDELFCRPVDLSHDSSNTPLRCRFERSVQESPALLESKMLNSEAEVVVMLESPLRSWLMTPADFREWLVRLRDAMDPPDLYAFPRSLTWCIAVSHDDSFELASPRNSVSPH